MTLFPAAVSAGEETVYWDAGHPQLDAGIFIFSLGAKARLGAGGSYPEFTDYGIDDFSFALSGRFAYERGKSRYWADYWAYSASSRTSFSADTTWGGAVFLSGENATASFKLSYLGLGLDKILVDAPKFRLAAVVGVNLVGLRYGLTEGAKGGDMEESLSALTVGVCTRTYVNDRLTIYFDMVGLSWTDLVGMDTGFFDPSGEYRVLDMGVMWSGNKESVAALRAGFRYFSLAFEDMNEAVDVSFKGFYLGVDLRW